MVGREAADSGSMGREEKDGRGNEREGDERE